MRLVNGNGMVSHRFSENQVFVDHLRNFVAEFYTFTVFLTRYLRSDNQVLSAYNFSLSQQYMQEDECPNSQCNCWLGFEGILINLRLVSLFCLPGPCLRWSVCIPTNNILDPKNICILRALCSFVPVISLLIIAYLLTT